MDKELSPNQTRILELFYSLPATKVVYTKKKRNELWKKASAKERVINFEEINKNNPALAHQISRSYAEKRNIQSAVFSECAYAQTLANMMSLHNFVNCMEDAHFSLPEKALKILNENNLVPRYAYANEDLTQLLVQAGGHGGIDSALISVTGSEVYTIEYKEPEAKTSEPDLPKYGEDGKIVVTEQFLSKYPHFKTMLDEHKDLNFFNVMGNNIHNFSDESVEIAVSNNYVKKYADVICTEDINGYLVMIPGNQAYLWAQIEGEIRPSGRNHYNVWTPIALRRFLEKKGATIVGDKVSILMNELTPRIERGGNGRVSGYKINSLFFVYAKDCVFGDKDVVFPLNKVQQLRPTIAGKMFFKNLDYEKVKAHYCA